MNMAAIDIGTNTVLLLVASVDDAGTMEALAYEQRVPRLGTGVDASGRLQPGAMDRVLAVLHEYQLLIAPFHPAATAVFGTSAVRDAANRDEFAGRIRRETGLVLEVLTGMDEAYWTYRGALSGVPGISRATVIDIGGGSTEVIMGEGTAVLRSASMNVGSVRLTERCFTHDPPLAAERASAAEIIRRAMSGMDAFASPDSTLLGVAGTATSLAILAQRRRDFSVDAVANSRLTHDEIHTLAGMLQEMPSAAIRELSSVMEGRADVIAAGAVILDMFMDACGFREMIVSERGVRYGIALREWEKRRMIA